MKTIQDVEIGTLVTDAYDCDSGVAIVKEQNGKKYYAYRDMMDEESLGSIIPVSDFDDDHLEV